MLWNFCLSHSYWQNFSLNGSLSVPGQKEKEKDGAQHNFPYSTGQGELWNAPLCRKRDIISSKIKKWRGWKKARSSFQPTQKPAETLLTVIKIGEYCTPACIPWRISCVSQAQFKETLVIAIPHHERCPLCCRGHLWMQSGGRGRTILHSATLAAFSGGTHSVSSDLLCYNTESRAMRFDLDKCAVLSPIPIIQDQIEGQHLFTLHWGK